MSTARHPLLLRFAQALGIGMAALSAAGCTPTDESKACRNDLPEGAACPSAEETEAHFKKTGELDSACGKLVGVVDGPEVDPYVHQCCYTVEMERGDYCAVDGRPLVIDGHAVTGSLRGRAWMGRRIRPRSAGSFGTIRVGQAGGMARRLRHRDATRQRGSGEPA